MGVGVSKSKLAGIMFDILIQLPTGTKNLKETIVDHMGLIGQMSATRDINAAWTEARRRAARECPEKFILDDRGVLHWNDGSFTPLDKSISAANYRKLNDLAVAENCTVNQLITKLIRHYPGRSG